MLEFKHFDLKTIKWDRKMKSQFLTSEDIPSAEKKPARLQNSNDEQTAKLSITTKRNIIYLNLTDEKNRCIDIYFPCRIIPPTR